MPIGIWKLLHMFFAFAYVGGLVVSEWNGRAARATEDWRQRALLFHIIHLATRTAGLAPLFLLGVFGNVYSLQLGYRMRDPWLAWVNGLWLVALLVMVFVNLPHASRLAALSRAAATGGSSEGFASALVRWRAGNVLQSVLYLALLALMAFPRRG